MVQSRKGRNQVEEGRYGIGEFVDVFCDRNAEVEVFPFVLPEELSEDGAEE